MFKTAEIKRENPMKRIAFALGVVVLVLSVSAWAQNTAQPKSGSAEQELLKLEKDWASAMLKGDVAFLERIYASDIFITNSDGTLWTRDQDIATMKSGETVFTTSVSDNMKVHIYGKTAVVTGRNESAGKEKGKDFSRQTLWTDTWVTIAGQWKCVATQVTLIAQK
jgi:ketosteroid isomerase-like protein